MRAGRPWGTVWGSCAPKTANQVATPKALPGTPVGALGLRLEPASDSQRQDLGSLQCPWAGQQPP